MSDFETAHQLEKAKAYQGLIPPKLAFEEIVKNRTLPPCSLNDFMDYLYYIEQNAESLQFFLWYCDYMQRWSELPPRQKVLSPVWDPEKAKEPRSRFVTYSHKRARSEKMNKILSIMDMDSKKEAQEAREERNSTHSLSSTNFSRPRTPSRTQSTSSTISTARSSTESIPGQHPIATQPFRDEVAKIVRHYIAEGALRQLNLAPKDRDCCLQATQHTTHPSALLSAFVVADANLRGQSHPNFVRWSITNMNRSRMLFLRLIGILLIILGLGLDIFFILSGLSRFVRIICLVLWWPGMVVLLAAFKGLCVILHFYDLRHARPWEQYRDAEAQLPEGKSINADAEDDVAPRSHSRKDTSSSQISAVDPLRKPSLQTLGPKNDYSKEPWVKFYMAQTFWQKVFEPTVQVQNASLQQLQDRSIFAAVLWAGLVASTATVGSLFVPSLNLYLV